MSEELDTKKKIKVLLTRSILEGHDIGIRMIAKKCREAGFEAVYTRFNQVEEIVKTVEEEDANVIGLSCSVGNHSYMASRLLECLKARDLKIPLIIGGVIPTRDILKLLEMGVWRVFGPGSDPQEAVKFIFDVADKS